MGSTGSVIYVAGQSETATISLKGSGSIGSLSTDQLHYAESHMSSSSTPLYNIEELDWNAINLKVGDTFNFGDKGLTNGNLKSFSNSLKSVQKLAKKYKTPVIFKTTGKTSSFSVTGWDGEGGYGDVNTGADTHMVNKNKWKVKNIQTKTVNGKKVMVVTIKQV